MEWKSVIVVALTILGWASADVARFENCETGTNVACTVDSVDITPCKDPLKGCQLKRRTNSSIVFTYTPHFAASKLKTQVFWDQGIKDLPFAGMDPDGCNMTPCPLQPDTSATYRYQLYLGKILPKGSFKIKWKLWNEENAAQHCCFTTNIKIH